MGAADQGRDHHPAARTGGDAAARLFRGSGAHRHRPASEAAAGHREIAPAPGHRAPAHKIRVRGSVMMTTAPTPTSHPIAADFLLDYATGPAPEPVAVLVAAHVALNPSSRATVRQLETAGGA